MLSADLSYRTFSQVRIVIGNGGGEIEVLAGGF